MWSKTVMASIGARTSRCIFLPSSRPKTVHSRWMSSTTKKQVESDVIHNLELEQPPPDQQTSNIHLYSSSETIKRQRINRDFRREGFVRIQDPKEATLKPLRQLVNHPCAAVILRDACSCTKCKDSGTGQREFNVANIPINLTTSNVSQDNQGNWTIKWRNDMSGWENHVSTFTPQQIERLQVNTPIKNRLSSRPWDREQFKENQFSVNFDEYMNSEPAFAATLFNLARSGLVFIKNVPEDENSVEHLANRISHLKSTFYGPTWDIRSVPNAKNVAYTNKYLGFHGDLLYMKEPPTVQFLHCIHNDAVGGESRFIDQFKALDVLCTEDRESLTFLGRTKLRYEYDNDGYYFSDIKPVIQWRSDSHMFPQRRVRGATNHKINDIYRVFWSPPFLGSIISDSGVHPQTLEQSMQAMKKYAQILEREDLIYEEKMEPGTCVMFDNLRVLHARNTFDVNTGRRWLKGTYVDGQDLWSAERRFQDHFERLEHEERVLLEEKRAERRAKQKAENVAAGRVPKKLRKKPYKSAL